MENGERFEMINNLTSVLESKGLNGSKLAAFLDVTPALISLFKSGKAIPRLEMALRIARALGVSVEDIFSINESEPSEEKAI